MVCDSSEGARARAATLAPRARLGHGFEEALAAADVDAVVLATPAKDHAEQARCRSPPASTCWWKNPWPSTPPTRRR